MAGNSAVRRLAKRVLYPLVSRRSYTHFQATAMAWDISRGAWTEPELRLLPAIVGPGETALDIGANFGLYSYHLSRLLGRSGRVHAFEPLPFACETLRLVARRLRLGNVVIHPVGCSDRPGRVKVRMPLQASGAGDATQGFMASRDDTREGREQWVTWKETAEVECELVRIDDALPPLPDLAFIKCDVQGAELLALRGAERTIEIHQPTILCEIDPWFAAGFGVSVEDVLGFFASQGYASYRYREPAGLSPVTADEIRREHHPVHPNYLFVPPRRRDRFGDYLSRD